MKGHPGGEEHTRLLLEEAALAPNARILDMGAGAGDAVFLMREMGFDAEGIDLCPRSESVREGDFLRMEFPDESFDAVLSQCAFYISGDPDAALREARRVLKPDGLLLLSDVFFSPPELPGFSVVRRKDMTSLWREYYLEALWREETDCACLPTGKCRYWSIVARKESTGIGSD